MADSTKANDTQTPVDSNGIKGEITYDEKVVQKIIGYALEKVDGLLDVDGGFFSNLSSKIVESNDVTKGIDVEVGKKQVAVDLKVVIEYGKNIPKLYDEMKTVIKDRVKEMTGLEVIEMNVHVVDVKTKKQYEASSVPLSEKASDAIGSASDKMKSTSNSKDKSKDSSDKERVE